MSMPKSILDRPLWCPHEDCSNLRTLQNLMCIGRLPKPVQHDEGFNDYRMCLDGADSTGDVFDLQINSSDIYNFRLLFDATDVKKGGKIFVNAGQ